MGSVAFALLAISGVVVAAAGHSEPHRRVNVAETVRAGGVAAPAVSVSRAAEAPAAESHNGTIRAVPYGPDAHQLLDLYLPARERDGDPVPTIVYLHSGGWISGSRANVADAAAAEVARGYAVASVDYQLAPIGGSGSFPAAVYDVKRAIRFLKANAARWGLDPAGMIVMGASAGGHLAALTGASVGKLEPDLTGSLAMFDSSVVAIVDLVGVTDLATFATTPHPWAAPLTADFLGCPIRNRRAACSLDLLHRASVATYVDATSPPIFLAYGAADNLVEPSTQGAPLAHTWLEAHHGDPQAAVYDLVADGGHNIGASQVDMIALDEFLDRAVGGPTLSARRVVLYGDSLAWEAQSAFRAALAATGISQVTTRTFGGTAICDWLPQMSADAAAMRPDAVVVEFSGNALTPCMKDATGTAVDGNAYFAKYEADARGVLDTFAPVGSIVFFAGAPINLRAHLRHDPNAGRLDQIYANLAASTTNTRYIAAGRSVTLDDQWTATLPCLPSEPCTGGRDSTGIRVNVVRAPDGAHFCPVSPAAVHGVIAACRAWSSGAYRYGTAMADPLPLELFESGIGRG